MCFLLGANDILNYFGTLRASSAEGHREGQGSLYMIDNAANRKHMFRNSREPGEEEDVSIWIELNKNGNAMLK